MALTPEEIAELQKRGATPQQIQLLQASAGQGGATMSRQQAYEQANGPGSAAGMTFQADMVPGNFYSNQQQLTPDQQMLQRSRERQQYQTQIAQLQGQGQTSPTLPTWGVANQGVPVSAASLQPQARTFAPIDLAAAQASLNQQVASGGINQAQTNFEMDRLRAQNSANTPALPTPPPAATPAPAQAVDLNEAKKSLDYQVATGGINQSQANFELERLMRENAAATTRVSDMTAGMAGGDKIVENALGTGVKLGNEFFPLGSLGRVQSELTPDVSATLERARLGPLQKNMAQVETGLSNLATNAGNVDPTLQAIMERRQAGLEGLTSPELTALREQGEFGLDRSMATAMRQAGASNMLAGRQGAVQGAQIPGIAEARALGGANLERDILLQNVAERNKRLADYQQLATDIDTNKYARQRQSLGDLGTFSQAQQGLDLASLKNYQDYLQQTRDDVLKRQVFNLGQLGQEKAGQIGMIFGAGQVGSGQSAQAQSYELGKESIEAQKKYYEAQLALLGAGMAPGGEEESGGSDDWINNPYGQELGGKKNPYGG
jgi:hypothetical protein